MLQSFVDTYQGSVSPDEADRTNQELRAFWETFVRDYPQKLCVFVGVLRELRHAISAASESSVWAWYERAIKPVVCGPGFKKSAVEDAQEFMAGAMFNDDGEDGIMQRVRISNRLCADLLSVYVARTEPLEEGDGFTASENAAVAQQVETVLIHFGRKLPRLLLYSLDDYIIRADTRLQALTLLSSFLRHQSPRLYQVVHTPLVQHLVKCLMNDTSVTVLSVALTSLIMLFPHIPASLNDKLPQLFLIYSRLLCWEVSCHEGQLLNLHELTFCRNSVLSALKIRELWSLMIA